MHRLRHILMILCATASLILTPAAAEAAPDNQLSCNGDGTVAGGRLYYYYSDIPVTGGSCQVTNPNDPQDNIIKHIFSYIICNFVVLLNEIMSRFYCGLQAAMIGTLGIVLTLYVAIFGAQMLMGTAQLNARDFMFRMLKIAGVWGLCTQSAWGIGFLFNFFLSFIATAGGWVVSGILSSDSPVINGPSNQPPIFYFLDSLIASAISGPLSAVADNKILGFFMALIFVFTPLYFIALWWIWTTVMTMIKAVISFLLSLAAIAFLITLCPIFLSFMLFDSLRHMFDRWLSYLVSYALQVVLVFAIIVFWLMIMLRFVSFYNELTAVIFPYNNTLLSEGPVSTPVDTYGLCPLDYESNNGIPSVRCKNPQFESDERRNTRPVSSVIRLPRYPNGVPQWVLDMEDITLPSRIPAMPEFVHYLFYHLISLILVTYAFSELLKQAHEIAKRLAGTSPPSLVPGGWGSDNYGGSRALEAGALRSGEASRQFSQLTGPRTNPR